MGIFTPKKAPAAKPAPTSGTDQLRQRLISRTRHRSLAAISGDINDIATTETNRAVARTVAAKMSDDANVAASIAKTLIGGLSGDINRAREITSDALQDFADGEDLPHAAKVLLTRYLFGDHQTFDAALDEIVLANPVEPATFIHPPRWTHPDPRIAKANADYQAELEAARPRRSGL